MLSNQLYKELGRLHHKKFRREHRRFFIEGVRLCEEAVAASATIRQVIICEDQKYGDRIEKLIETVKDLAIPIHHATSQQFKTLTATESPQGILAVIEYSLPQPWSPAREKRPIVLALDGIADPGNLGTILRSASWFGVESILLSGDCAEVYNPKTIRSTMGALFHLKLYEDLDLPTVLADSKQNGFRIISTTPAGGTPVGETSPSGRNLLLIGSEANGVRESLAPLIDLSITIKACGHGESLNAAVAAGIVLHELARREKT